MSLSTLITRKQPGRKITGMAAVLLPFESTGQIAEAAYCQQLEEIYAAGLTPAVNMDTGYVNLLTEDEKLAVLKLAQAVAKGRPFLAGAYIERLEGETVALYRSQMETLANHGGTPIIFQSIRMHSLAPAELAALYSKIAVDFETVYGFELGRMFAPNGDIWSDESFERILDIPQIKGAKHSSLDRMVELRRLEMRDRLRPDFKVLTGNDLGIDMVEYGSDYLLGLATFSPAKFAERDALWEANDSAYYAVADALQYLGNVAFRAPVPAYKHSAATFLNLLGKLPTAQTHPKSAERPPWEAEILTDCAKRLGLVFNRS